jgi:hypothetical protein
MIVVTNQPSVPYEENQFDTIDERIVFLHACTDEMSSNDKLQRNN